jgi:hypothetical protein
MIVVMADTISFLEYLHESSATALLADALAGVLVSRRRVPVDLVPTSPDALAS